jgi:hypothetical protein
VGLDVLEELPSQVPELLLGELWEQESEEEGAQPDHVVWVGSAGEDLVVLVDLGLEGGVLRDELEQRGVLGRGGGVDRIED